jgi:hypothetical protein
MKNLHIAICVLAVCTTGCATNRVTANGPSHVKINARSSVPDIRKFLLQFTPVGSSGVDVLQFIDTRLQVRGRVRLQNGGAIDFANPPAKGGPRIGTKSIGNLEVAWHWVALPLLPPVRYVYASWGFDDDERLVDITVHKMTFGPIL